MLMLSTYLFYYTEICFRESETVLSLVPVINTVSISLLEKKGNVVTWGIKRD
jgi:hypothetical protein